jgi:hypothetical protein
VEVRVGIVQSGCSSSHDGAAFNGGTSSGLLSVVHGNEGIGGFGITTAHPPQPPPPLGGAATMIELTQGITAEERPQEVTISDAVLVPTVLYH